MTPFAKVTVGLHATTLADLEDLCRAARDHGMTDGARLLAASQWVVLEEEHAVGSADVLTNADPWAGEPQTQEADE